MTSPSTYPDDVARHMQRLFGPARQRQAAGLRDEYLALLKLPQIAESAKGHQPTVTFDEQQTDCGSYTRRQGWIETEPNVRVHFWLLTPKGDGPFPLAITPHGHETGDSYVGIAGDENIQKKIDEQDQDVAVQAVEHGYLTIAPATRGISPNHNAFVIQDIAGRYNHRDCHAHSWHAIAAGRTLMGERVWDLMRLMDWALTLPQVDTNAGVLMLGNSGGGMATLHTAAADQRVTTAVCSCAFNHYVSPQGVLLHCTCNMIPGIATFGEMWHVASLIAPRRLLTVNGNADKYHPVADVEFAAKQLARLHAEAGCPDQYTHRFGNGGHRFYAQIMWPWIQQATKD